MIEAGSGFTEGLFVIQQVGLCEIELCYIFCSSWACCAIVAEIAEGAPLADFSVEGFIALWHYLVDFSMPPKVVCQAVFLKVLPDRHSWYASCCMIVCQTSDDEGSSMQDCHGGGACEEAAWLHAHARV